MLETLRSRPPGARAAAGRVRGARWRAARRRARLSRGLERHRRAAPGDPRGRRRGRRRGGDHAVQLRGLGQLPALRGRPAGLLRHRPAHAQHRPARPPRRRWASAPRACCRCTSSATRPTCRRSSALAGRARALDRRGRLRGARRRARRRRDRRRARQPGASSASTRTSRSRRGRGARWSAPTPAPRSASTPSATRAGRPTWAGSTTTGSASTTGSTTSPARSASPSSSASTSCSPARARVAALYREALAGVEGLDAALPRRGRRPALLVRLRGPAPAAAWTATPPSRALRERGRRHQALPAGDPPDELLPRALRPPRGRVPGLRGRGAPLARAAVLPRADRRPGRAGRRGAARDDRGSAERLDERHERPAARAPAGR